MGDIVGYVVGRLRLSTVQRTTIGSRHPKLLLANRILQKKSLHKCQGAKRAPALVAPLLQTYVHVKYRAFVYLCRVMPGDLVHHRLFDLRQPKEAMRMSSALPRVDKQSATPEYSLFTVVDKYSDDRNVADIVEIHSLNGHFEKAWTTAGRDGAKVKWLRDPLPKRLLNTRTLAFSYNSQVQLSKSTSDVIGFASQLLEQILTVCKTPAEKVRPIVFICQSR